MKTFAAIVTVLVVAAACGSDTDDTRAADTASTETTETTGSATTAPDTTTPDTTTADSAADTTTNVDSEELFPDVVDATAELSGDGTWTFAATLSSPYDSAERYADAWRVRNADGTVYGIRELLHDHANEQPFTRSQSGIEIPDDVDVVIVEGRDQVSGWGGATVEVPLDR